MDVAKEIRSTASVLRESDEMMGERIRDEKAEKVNGDGK